MPVPLVVAENSCKSQSPARHYRRPTQAEYEQLYFERLTWDRLTGMTEFPPEMYSFVEVTYDATSSSSP